MKFVRRKLIAGNWKMHKTRAEGRALVKDILLELGDKFDEADIVLCPPFTALVPCMEVLGDHSRIMIGAQNMHQETHGAFTGEISGSMLRELYCRYVILGHSERRQYFNETNDLINAKTKRAVECKLRPIVCVGEVLAEREASRTHEVITRQVQECLANLEKKEWTHLTVAYEPVWAIGTGKVAAPAQAQEVHALIRQLIEQIAGKPIAQKIRILYGGSVKPDNAAELMKQPDVDGALVGGASLDARSFVAIIKNSIIHP